MLTSSYVVVKCFPSVKRASIYLVAYGDTGLGDLSYLGGSSQQRINGLGKCLMLWASLYSEFGSSNPWRYTEPNVDHLMFPIREMTELASQVDEEYVQFWIQLRSVLSEVDEWLPRDVAC